MPTTLDDVIWILDRIATCGADPIIAGGWGVDALLGRQSRDHRDLDVLLDHGAVANAIEALTSEGFVRTTDWMPVRLELSDIHNDRHVDLHPLFDDGRQGFWQHGLDNARFDYPADVLTHGLIGGRKVNCLTARKQLELHQGYDFRSIDHHDVATLTRMTTDEDRR